MQKWADGSPTNFREKIMRSLEISAPAVRRIEYEPKLHTMRESFRVKKGMMLDLAYWSGRPYNSSPERFVDQTLCVSTQKIGIQYWTWVDENDSVSVYVDGKEVGTPVIERLARNDGFESVDKFFEHFNKSAEYNLIHWTNLRY